LLSCSSSLLPQLPRSPLCINCRQRPAPTSPSRFRTISMLAALLPPRLRTTVLPRRSLHLPIFRSSCSVALLLPPIPPLLLPPLLLSSRLSSSRCRRVNSCRRLRRARHSCASAQPSCAPPLLRCLTGLLPWPLLLARVLVRVLRLWVCRCRRRCKSSLPSGPQPPLLLPSLLLQLLPPALLLPLPASPVPAPAASLLPPPPLLLVPLRAGPAPAQARAQQWQGTR
jgi:hypothetical protein